VSGDHGWYVSQAVRLWLLHMYCHVVYPCGLRRRATAAQEFRAARSHTPPDITHWCVVMGSMI
jgi:hypothetical protein